MKVRGWRGEFQAKGISSIYEGPQFFIQPWHTGKETEVMQVTASTSDFREIRSWLSSLNLMEDPGSIDADIHGFEKHIRFIQAGIAQGDFEKIVASRTVTLNIPTPDVESVFFMACDAYPQAMVYLLVHPVYGTWFGASPEKFITANNGRVETTAIAGTLATAGQQWTSKEEREQTVIEKYMGELLHKFGVTDVKISDRTELHQGSISHLASKITFLMDESRILQFIKELHPTPAVGGYPKKEALMFISRFENLDRQLYSGWLGWSEDGEFHSWVNLRCARLYQNKIRLFAGCGINDQSNADMEWRETAAKISIIGRFFRE